MKFRAQDPRTSIASGDTEAPASAPRCTRRHFISEQLHGSNDKL